jgi:hypothetical protein
MFVVFCIGFITIYAIVPITTVTSISLKHESPIDTIDLDFALSAIDLYRSSICLQDKIQGVRFMVFNVTFNNISVISWMSVLLVEETGIHVANGNVSQCTEEGDQPKSSPNKWTFSVQTFNIIALCQDEYVVEPPSLEFLVDHGFDCKMWFNYLSSWKREHQ